MPSPKFDSLNVSFSKVIGDVVISASTNGMILSNAERDGYINRALDELFRKSWEGVQGDSKQFIEIFPELYKSQTITTTADGTYTLAANNTFDFFKAVDGILDTSLIKFLKKSLYAIVKTNSNQMYLASPTNLLAFEIQGTISFFPASSFNAKTVILNYIRRPVDPSTGSGFTNGGTNDHPFNAIWHSEILKIALQLFLIDTQEMR